MWSENCKHFAYIENQKLMWQKKKFGTPENLLKHLKIWHLNVYLLTKLISFNKKILRKKFKPCYNLHEIFKSLFSLNKFQNNEETYL